MVDYYVTYTLLNNENKSDIIFLLYNSLTIINT